MKLPDYSEWLTYERMMMEEAAWGSLETATWPHFVRAIENLMQVESIESVIELGCGTGWVPSKLPKELFYMGIDANEHCIEFARSKNPLRRFIRADIRQAASEALVQATIPADLVCSFSCLKHFGLDEWDDVVRGMLQLGRIWLFSMPVGLEVKDDGTEFPHVWVDEPRLRQAVMAAGHEITALSKLSWGETMVETWRR